MNMEEEQIISYASSKSMTFKREDHQTTGYNSNSCQPLSSWTKTLNQPLREKNNQRMFNLWIRPDSKLSSLITFTQKAEKEKPLADDEFRTSSEEKTLIHCALQ